MKSISRINQILHELPELDRAALDVAYRQNLGRSSDKSASDELLRLAITCRLQKLLNARLRHRLAQVLNVAETLTSLAIAADDVTLLVREWKGRFYDIAVLEDGIYCNGTHYQTLAAAAAGITGGKKTAAEFFGVSLHGAR